MRYAPGLALLAACTAGAGAPDAGVDAAPVSEVSCLDVTPAVTIGTAAGEYAPNPATIGIGEVVQWQMDVGHTVMSRPEGTFEVGQGEQRCYRFSAAGDYEYYCTVHGFIGMLHVQ